MHLVNLNNTKKQTNPLILPISPQIALLNNYLAHEKLPVKRGTMHISTDFTLVTKIIKYFRVNISSSTRTIVMCLFSGASTAKAKELCVIVCGLHT